jgi:hypothetical protein
VSKSEDYRAMALECDDRTRTSPRYENRVQYEESAKHLRALAAQWERLDAEQTQASTAHLRSRHPHGRFRSGDVRASARRAARRSPRQPPQ